jgi:hypothetical protein
MKLSPRALQIAAALVLIGILVWVVAAITAPYRRQPSGYFSSYKLIAHDSADALHFTNGVIFHETCCGRSVFGTYRRSSAGSWISENVYSKKVRETNLNGLTPMVVTKRVRFTNEVILEPGFLWLTLYTSDEPTNIYRLPRKLFLPKIAN